MIRFYPTIFNGTIPAPASKAHAQRLLFAASLPSTATTVQNVPACEDIKTTLTVLEDMGCRIQTEGTNRLDVTVDPFPKNNYAVLDLNFKESATAARFATAIAAAFGFSANCRATGTLIKREQVSLTSRMALRGATFNSFSYPLTLSGKLRGGDFQLAGDEGSQFISALLLALPNVWDDSTITLTSPLVDSSFVDLTIDAVQQFGIEIEKTETGFFIPSKQYYTSPGTVRAENDWGLASMWTVAGASTSLRGGRVTVTDLPNMSPQIYRSVNESLSLVAQKFASVDFDCSCCPDLATVYAALALPRRAHVNVFGVPQLKHKETDRLAAIGKCIKSLGGDFKEHEDGVSVDVPQDLEIKENTVINCGGDPAVFMGMAIAAANMDVPVILTDNGREEKYYHNFLLDYEALGGRFEVLE